MMTTTPETGTPFGRRVRRERERRGWTLRELGDIAGMAYVRIQRIETADDADKVNLVDAARLAHAFGMPVSALVNGSRIRERVAAAARAVDEAKMDDAIDEVLPALELAAQLDSIEGPDQRPRTLDRRPRDTEAPSVWGERVAREVRTSWGIPHGPIQNLDRVIEDYTPLMVLVADLPAGVDGLTLADPETGHAVLATARTPYWERQRFTLAHELGHYLAGNTVIEVVGENGSTPDETAASEFARNLLVPKDDLSAAGPDLFAWDAESIARTAWEYQVAPKVVAIQLDRMKAIDPSLVDEVAGLSAETWSLLGGWAPERESLKAAAQTRRVPPALVDRARRAYDDNMLAVTAIARLLAIDPDDLKTALDAVRPSQSSERGPSTRLIEA